MATITYNDQSFAIDGRRVWIVGAAVPYARVEPDQWPQRIAAVAQAGFNTILTACPWGLHEPRKGRYCFQERGDVRRFVQLCGQAGLRVVIRAGPFVGDGYDAGGLPGWLTELPDIALRQANPIYLERMGKFLRKLAGELSDLQVTDGGPILAVQNEHAWHCSNQEQIDRYLNEITRILRESGIGVPILNANDLWTPLGGTIDTWRGWDEMLSHVRQLRVVQPDAPRVVSEFDVTGPSIWGAEAPGEDRSPMQALRYMAEILAAGGQPIVSPFHGGTNFGFLGGQMSGADSAPVTTSAALTAPLGEAGARTAGYRALKRLAMFASHFGAVFADLDPAYQPVTLELGGAAAGAAPARGSARGRGVAIVPQRGGLGRVVFVFGAGGMREATLLLENGVRMPISLGDQPVGWYAQDVDLQGQGRLDYANLCPHALVGRSTLVLFGPEKSPVYVSIGGSPLRETVPTGRKPLVIQHKGITLVICNAGQIDATYHDGSTVHVGIGGFGPDGAPLPARGFGQATVIGPDGEVSSRRIAAPRGSGASASRRRERLGEWEAAPAGKQVSGESQRYATLAGPRTLAGCGAPTGYGWYRVQFKSTAAGKQVCHLPFVSDRAHLFLDGQFERVVGTGPGAEAGPFELRLTRGNHVLVALVDNLGRPAGGHDVLQHKGLYGHLYNVKAMRAVKPKKIQGKPADPFVLHGYVHGLSRGQRSETEQMAWTFTHARRSPILVDVHGAEASGTFVLNDEPVAYYAGHNGSTILRFLLDPAEGRPFKRGRNVLRFASDAHQSAAMTDIARHTTLYECEKALTGDGSWSYAKWEPAPSAEFGPCTAHGARAIRHTPCWWRTTFQVEDDPTPLWLSLAGLSKGQVHLNGENLGRFFTARADGRAVGPQTRLYLPEPRLRRDQPNELVLFDEHGHAPFRAELVRSETGEYEIA